MSTDDKNKTWWDRATSLTATSAIIVLLVGGVFTGMPYLLTWHSASMDAEREFHRQMWKDVRDDVTDRLDTLIKETRAVHDELRRRNIAVNPGKR